MTYFLYGREINLNEPVRIEGEEARHILGSRRIKVGEVIEIQDIKGTRFLSRIEDPQKRSVIANPFQEIETPPEPKIVIRLYQALIKEKALEFIIQKVTELGVTEIVFFESRFSQTFSSSKQSESASRRWERIALEACKQSGRVFPPEISFGGSLEDVIASRGLGGVNPPVSFCFIPGGALLNKDLLSELDQEVDLFIGPEGGFDMDEIKKTGSIEIGLGARVLRADTAAIVSAGIFQTLLGDLGSFSFKV